MNCVPVRLRPGEWRSLVRVPVATQMLIDGGAWTAGLSFAMLARYDFRPAGIDAAGLVLTCALAIAVQSSVGLSCHLYRGRYRFGCFEEVAGVTGVVAVTTAVLSIVDLLAPTRLVPASVPVAGALTALVLMAGGRYTARLVLERYLRPAAASQRVIVFGAGEGGYQVLQSMLRHPEGSYLPVALLDDDVDKRNLRILGVPVLGGRHTIRGVAEQTGADPLLIAIPSADALLLREITGVAEEAGLVVKVLPPVADLLDARVGISDIRDINLADLLGRRQVDTDLDAIAGYLSGKRVLVTGAGGSIGSELCRQIHRYRPAELMMLDRDESALHAVQLSIHGKALFDSPDVILADIRDVEHLNEIFEQRRPEVVFHAAALKHLPMSEQYPGEAIKTNVWGTLNVLDAAAAVGAERFVNISTDKAADPISVLGYSKRIAERLTAHVARRASGVFLSVRFGNVLGSRGSVLTAFAAQIAAGGPITVTDPQVTRYFMTVQEAVQLVIQAGAIGRPGEALVLDMGEPVRIAEVAARLAAEAPRPVSIAYTGLRPGEKLHEDLFGVAETDVRPVHPLISHVPVPALEPVAALAMDPGAERPGLLSPLVRYGRDEDALARHRQPTSAHR